MCQVRYTAIQRLQGFAALEDISKHGRQDNRFVKMQRIQLHATCLRGLTSYCEWTLNSDTRIEEDAINLRKAVGELEMVEGMSLWQ